MTLALIQSHNPAGFIVPVCGILAVIAIMVVVRLSRGPESLPPTAQGLQPDWALVVLTQRVADARDALARATVSHRGRADAKAGLQAALQDRDDYLASLRA